MRRALSLSLAIHTKGGIWNRVEAGVVDWLVTALTPSVSTRYQTMKCFINGFQMAILDLGYSVFDLNVILLLSNVERITGLRFDRRFEGPIVSQEALSDLFFLCKQTLSVGIKINRTVHAMSLRLQPEDTAQELLQTSL